MPVATLGYMVTLLDTIHREEVFGGKEVIEKDMKI
jgi:hypothetical protein